MSGWDSCARTSHVRNFSAQVFYLAVDPRQRYHIPDDCLASSLGIVSEPTCEPLDIAGPADETVQPTNLDVVIMSNPSDDSDRAPNPDEAGSDRDSSPSCVLVERPRSRSPRRQRPRIRADKVDLSLKFCMRCGARTIVPPTEDDIDYTIGDPMTHMLPCKACNMVYFWQPGGEIAMSEKDLLEHVNVKVDAGYAGLSRL